MVDCYLLLLVDKNNFSDWFKLEHVTSYHLLLLAFIGGKKNNFSSWFKLEHVTTYYLLFLLWKCYENVVVVALLNYKYQIL